MPGHAATVLVSAWLVAGRAHLAGDRRCRRLWLCRLRLGFLWPRLLRLLLFQEVKKAHSRSRLACLRLLAAARAVEVARVGQLYLNRAACADTSFLGIDAFAFPYVVIAKSKLLAAVGITRAARANAHGLQLLFLFSACHFLTRVVRARG